MNIQEAFCNIVWGGGGGGGEGTTDEKGVCIQIQNTIVSSKALVLVNCLNTFVHDCGFQLVNYSVTFKNFYSC